MAERHIAEGWSGQLRRLDEASQGRRDPVKRIGGKAQVLAKLSRAGTPIPESWVLEAHHFEEIARGCLPRKHDIRSLIKLSGTRVGDERCARAYREMLAEPFPEALLEAIAAFCAEIAAGCPRGLAVRPSLAEGLSRAGAATQHLHSSIGARTPAEVVEAIRRVWASGVLSHAVAGYAACGLKDASLAVLIQEVVPLDDVGLLTRTTGPSAPVGREDWHLGTVPSAGKNTPWRRKAQLLSPLSLGKGGHDPAPALRRMRALLDPNGLEQLIDLGVEGERELGPGAVLHFAAESTPEGGQVHVISADEGPRWQNLRGGDEHTVWVEITLAGRAPCPATALSQSVVERAVRGALTATLSSLRCKLDSEATLISRWCSRSYLNLDALTEALADVPLLATEDLIHAVGGLGAVGARALAGRVALLGRSRWRSPIIASSALAEQVTLDREVSDLERAIERDASRLAQMDLTLLPSDAVATTLVGAQALLERSCELWAKCAASALAHQISIRTLLRRRMPDKSAHLGYDLVGGNSGPVAVAMTASFERLVEVFRDDQEARARLAEGGVTCSADLPDGQARGALGQFLSRFGDLSWGAFELSQPRWGQDASELLRMVSLLLKLPSLASVAELQQQARAASDAELARYEPELGMVERRLMRSLLGRSRDLSHKRAVVDRLVFRALTLVRQVALDIDRRLRRIDPDVGELGAFHCSSERLVGALKSGRPELSRILQMRAVERRMQSREPAPPMSFVASPPRGGIPLVPAANLSGLGVSPGVVEGRARLVHGALPERIERGDILVTTSLDPAMTPLCLAVSAVVAESGGALSMGAEALRTLGVPAVMSVENALLHISEGEMLRVDGSLGTVQRLAEQPQCGREAS